MNKQDGFELTRRKILAGIGGVGVASAGAGLGTSAYFSDAETFEDNVLSAGELDLRIDWQQKYFGPTENRDHYAPYGSAGYPFVNAHPDHDGDGEQSLDLGEFDEGEFADDDHEVFYTDDDANIQEYLTCGTLSNYAPGDFDNDNRSQDSLVELEDLKPGDCGEITFSYHLCDNPGYVWLVGGAGEIDETLAEAVEVRMWYDLACDNQVQDEDRMIFEWGSLRDVFGPELDGSVQLDPTYYDLDYDEEDGEDDDSTGGCPELGKIEYEGGTFVPEGEGAVLDPDDFDEDYDYAVELEFEGEPVHVGITAKEYDGDQPRVVGAELVEGVFEDVISGWCVVQVKGGPNTNTFAPGDAGLCVTGVNGLYAPDNRGGNRPGISNITFFACPADAEPPNLCFPADETYCIGFEWCLPVDGNVERVDGLDDVNDLQGASAAFDLGFYTEQCRHNDDPAGPAAGGD